MTPHREFEPKLVTILREGYSRRQFAHGLAARARQIVGTSAASER